MFARAKLLVSKVSFTGVQTKPQMSLQSRNEVKRHFSDKSNNFGSHKDEPSGKYNLLKKCFLAKCGVGIVSAAVAYTIKATKFTEEKGETNEKAMNIGDFKVDDRVYHLLLKETVKPSEKQ